jgi:Mrp family chromosome partitioning ATPase
MKLSQTKQTALVDTEPLIVSSPSGGVLAAYRFDVVEALRYLLARATRREPLPRRLSLLAPLRQEGVTHLSRALAATLACDLRATVCAVELNWWWPSSLPGVAQPGLAGVLSGQVSLEAALVCTTDPCLAWLPAGNLDPGRRSPVARSQALEAILANLGRQFDYLILDIPAMRATSDALPLASLGQAGCLVVSQGGASISTAQRALDEIAPLPMLGVLMNRMNLKTPSFLLQFIPET